MNIYAKNFSVSEIFWVLPIRIKNSKQFLEIFSINIHVFFIYNYVLFSVIVALYGMIHICFQFSFCSRKRICHLF